VKHAPVEISLTDTDNNPQFVLWNCQKAALDLHTQCEELEAEIERLTNALRTIECACIMPRPGVVGAVMEIARDALAATDPQQ
jgi:hypothetical protein